MNADESYQSIAAYVDASRARIAELEAELDAQNDEFMQSLAEKYAEIERLQSHGKEAMELLEAAVADLEIIQKRVQETTRTAPVGGEHKCVACNEKDCQYCGYGDCWAWQHADRYEALKAQSTTQEE